MATRLSLATLGQLGPSVGIPGYRRDELSPGIVHVGVGNFHRAHQAAYLDELFESGLDHDWAIIGTGVRESDAGMGRDLAAQDFLTTVVTQEAERSQARVTGAMIDFVAPGDAVAIIERLVDPRTRIVSLTVTEGGYYIDPATQAFDPGHPDIVGDAVNRLALPKTAFGLIAAGLLKRRAAGLPPFTVMSCDNLPGNGHVTAAAVAGLVDLVDPAAARWIRETVAFPNGMVDRITPATSNRERQTLRDDFGVEDHRPVFCEDFRQWVLEDHFPAGRPRLEEVGVQFVADVAPFELMKIRILNGGHATIAYPAGLLGIHFVHEAMEDAQIARFLSVLLDEEIIPVVPPVRIPIWPPTSAPSSGASPIRRSATRSAGSAWTAPTASRNSFCRRYATRCGRAGLSMVSRSSAPCGVATATARPKADRRLLRMTPAGRA